jgi:hypothetical protein
MREAREIKGLAVPASQSSHGGRRMAVRKPLRSLAKPVSVV